MTTRARLLSTASIVAFAATLAACGSSNTKDSGGDSGATLRDNRPPANAKRGGTLTVLQNSDIDYVDAGVTYFQLTYAITSVTQRALYGYKPDETLPTPDFASEMPRVSEGGKVATIKVRRGVRFSPPVNREADARDAAYALERSFLPSVPNPYIPSYLGTLEGLQAFKDGKAKTISGLQTPDKWTLVLRFTKPVAGYATAALVLPASAPVPREYASRFDAKAPSKYGEHQVATGPYMYRNDAKGTVLGVGYRPQRSIELVRNPNWDAKTDFRPAFVDRVLIKEGVDPNVGGRQILKGSHMISGEAPPASIARLADTEHKGQAVYVGGTGPRYVGLRTDRAPFDDINVRKAVAAAMPKRAMLLTRGGLAAGDIASHYIPPGMPGFEEAGGKKGDPAQDFNQQDNGNPELAASYLKKAGFSSGRFSGKTITMIADNSDPSGKTAQVVLQTMQKLGFKVQFRAVSRATMYTKYCNVPSQQPDVCPSVGWVKDFNDPLNMVDVPFNGEAIVREGNANWAMLDDKALNAEIDAAKAEGDPKKRAELAARIDKRVSGMAVSVPWAWDKFGNLRSRDVNGVIAEWNASWDLSYTSLK